MRPFQAQFVGAISEGEFDLRVTVVRRHLTIRALRAELSQQGTMAVVAQLRLGLERSGPVHDESPAPCMPAPGPYEMLLLADPWFPACWAGVREAVPVSTLALSVPFHQEWDPAARYPRDYLAAHFRTGQVAQGYADEHGRMWLPDGRLALQSQQLVWIDFSKPHRGVDAA